MPNIPFEQINWLAVLVAAIATFFLGAVWYMALFGKKWQRLNGYSDEKIKQMQKARPPHVFFGVMLFSYALMAAALAVLAAWIGVASAGHGAVLGLVVWAGAAVAIGLTHWVANDRPFGVYVIDLSYQLVFLLMTGVILGAWR